MKKIEIRLKKDFLLNKHILLYIFLIVPFLEIDSLWFYMGRSLHQGLALICLSIINVVILFKYKCFYLDKFILCFAAYEVISVSSALLHGSLTFGILYSIVVLWTILQFIHFEFDKVLKAFVVIFLLIILLDFVSLSYFQEARIINSETPLQNRFSAITGGRNALAPTLVPMTAIVVFYCFLKSERRTLYTTAVIFLSAVTVVLGESATGSIVVLFGALLYAFFPLLKIDTKVYLWGYMGVFALLVVFTNILIGNSGFQWLLEKVGRSTDLSLRPVVWDNAFKMIQDHFLIGGGRGNTFPVIVSEVIRYDNFSEAHNMFIQLLLDDGILGLVFYCSMIIQALKRIEAKKYFSDRILVVGIICFMINGLMESLQSKILIFILLGVANEYSGRKYEKKRNTSYCSYSNL